MLLPATQINLSMISMCDHDDVCDRDTPTMMWDTPTLLILINVN